MRVSCTIRAFIWDGDADARTCTALEVLAPADAKSVSREIEIDLYGKAEDDDAELRLLQSQFNGD